LFTIAFYAQELPADAGTIKASAGIERDTDSMGPAGDSTVKVIRTEASLTAISSTAPGGLWSSSSTWVGGVVPGAGDDVTISPGSAVVIDTSVTVANLTVGPDVSFNVGVLTFDPSAARVLTVNGDLTVSGLGILATPSTGTVTTHTITVGGNLTNNGILDLSTNSNLVGAGLVFTGASNNTFGGGGSQTNIRTITVNKGTSTTSTLNLTVSNFTVQGSATDTAASGYLTLTNGTFKISGTFTGNHRTFPTASYAIPATAGFWLNDPNYTVAAQTGDAVVSGVLQITTGVYNVGTAATDVLRVASTGGFTGGLITVEGGSLNVSGAMRTGDFFNRSYMQYGGTTTTCIAGNFSPCFDLIANGFGGKLVIQTPAAIQSGTVQDFMGTFASLNGTTVVFGNANTPGTGEFTFSAIGPAGMVGLALEIDTSAGAHTVKAAQGFNPLSLTNVNIGPGGTLDIGGNTINLKGAGFINNGTFKPGPNTHIDLAVEGPADFTFSGTGVVSGAIGFLGIGVGINLILDPGIANIHVREIYMDRSSVTNAYRLTLGNNDALPSTITLSFNSSLDSAPVFDLGTGGQKVVYGILGTTSRDTGNEINPSRQLAGLSAFGGTCCTTVLNITGGDLTVNGPIEYNGIINTGGNKLRHLSGTITTGGFRNYVIGTVVRRFSEVGQTYDFPTGDTKYAPAGVTASSLPSGPAEVAVSGGAPALAGLNPSISAPFHWNIEQSGTMTSKLEFVFINLTNSGSTGLYRAWRSTPSGPVPVAGTASSSTGTVSAPGLVNLTASWGVSERPTPTIISISGSVLASNGVGIRNATVRISGPELPTRTALTGSFGTYSFGGIESGQEYTVFVSAKRNRFTPPSQTIVPNANVTDLNFVANPQE
jgi:hypothetical protein